MPWTFSHPAAVLPLKRFCPRYLSFPALLVGSAAPDFGYYVGQIDFARVAHSLLGSVLVCLPSGMLLLVALMLLREPLLFLLPRIHRDVIALRVFPFEPLSFRSLCTIACSIVIGAWTHIAWDAFTHAGRWGELHFPWAGETALTFAGEPIAVYMLLQHASTVIGALVLLCGYRRLLNAYRGHAVEDLCDVHRRRLLALLAMVAMVVALLTGLNAAHGSHIVRAAGDFFFGAAVAGTVAFVVLYVSVAVLIYGRRVRTID